MRGETGSALILGSRVRGVKSGRCPPEMGRAAIFLALARPRLNVGQYGLVLKLHQQAAWLLIRTPPPASRVRRWAAQARRALDAGFVELARDRLSVRAVERLVECYGFLVESGPAGGAVPD